MPALTCSHCIPRGGVDGARRNSVFSCWRQWDSHQQFLHSLTYTHFLVFLIIAILTGFRWYLTILCLFNKFISVFGYTGSLLLWGPLSSCGARAFHRGGVSSQSSGFSSCGAQAHLPHSMWGVPGSGAEPVSSVLAGGFFTTVSREAPPPFLFFHIYLVVSDLSYRTQSL